MRSKSKGDSTDCFSSTKRSEVMRAVGHFDTPVEKKLRKALWAAGVRYRLHVRIGRTRPDVVFPSRRVALFIDGCFWHGCPIHYSAPRGNAEFWRDKIRYNRDKDRRHVAELTALGWRVVRVWECEVNGDTSAAADRVLALLRSANMLVTD